MRERQTEWGEERGRKGGGEGETEEVRGETELVKGET